MTVASWFTKMTGNAQSLNNLEDLLVEQLQDLYDAENRLIDALPKMAEAAHMPALKQAFQDHLRETEAQKRRLEQAFEQLGKEAKRETCEAMQGLIAEGQEMIGLEGDDEVKDAGLIAAAQRVEHYEIAGYGCARAFARRLGHDAVAKLLQETLDEETVPTPSSATSPRESSIRSRPRSDGGRRTATSHESPVAPRRDCRGRSWRFAGWPHSFASTGAGHGQIRT